MVAPHEGQQKLTDKDQVQVTDSKNKSKSKKKNEKKKQKTRIKKQQVVPTDPLGIPPEVFSHLISLLRTDQVATTLAVCKSWRVSIRDDFTLHQELSFWNKGRGVTAGTLLRHFIRHSELARNKLVRLYLNMCPLWSHHVEHGGDYDGSACSHFFKDLLSKSKKSLKHLSLRFLPGQNEHFNLEIFGFIECVIGELLWYPKLETICIVAPLAVIFKIEDHSNRKSLEVIDNSSDFRLGGEALGIIDYQIIHSIAREAAGLVGNDTGFTEFAVTDITLLSNYHQDLDVDHFSILDTLRSSKKSLRDLYLDVRISGTEAWEFGLDCPDLLLWKVILKNPEPVVAGTANLAHLDVPEGVEMNSKLRTFDLESYDYTFEWKSVIRWIGNNLEDLSLSECGDGEILNGLTEFQLILQNYVDTLKNLRLFNIFCKNKTHLTQPKNFNSFSNLKSLLLNKVDDAIYEILGDCFYPQLEYLTIRCEKSEQNAFDCFLTIVKANSSRLKTIGFDHNETPAPRLPAEDLELDLSRVETLAFGRRNEEVGRWLFIKEYPNLRCLESTPTLEEDFRLKSPLLSKLQESEDPSEEGSLESLEDESDAEEWE